MVPELQDWIEATFVAQTDGALARGISEGVSIGDSIMESESLFRTPVGKDLRGHVRRAGVLWRLQDMCMKGDLPWRPRSC